jgi:cytoskeletal protein RodZ
MELKMEVEDRWVLTIWIGLAFAVIGLFYFFGWISHRAWHIDCLLCFLIVSVLWGFVSVVLAIEEATAAIQKSTASAIKKASQRKVDKGQ